MHVLRVQDGVGIAALTGNRHPCRALAAAAEPPIMLGGSVAVSATLTGEDILYHLGSSFRVLPAWGSRHWFGFLMLWQ